MAAGSGSHIAHLGGYAMRTFDFTPLFRNTIGFDHMQQLLDATTRRADSEPSYPPYNIENVDENVYRISMAVAGFGEDDLDVTATENSLVIGGKVAKDKDQNAKYLHHGIATRSFQRTFELADHIKVTGARMENGMLYVDLEREVPEEMKPRKIKIRASHPASLADKAKRLVGADNADAA